jgi:hypothetical protein
MSDLEFNKRTVVAFFTRAFNDHEPDDVRPRGGAFFIVAST